MQQQLLLLQQLRSPALQTHSHAGPVPQLLPLPLLLQPPLQHRMLLLLHMPRSAAVQCSKGR
jgi:hypothetical protein